MGRKRNKEWEHIYYDVNKEKFIERMNKYRDTIEGLARNRIHSYNAIDKKYNRGRGDLDISFMVSLMQKPCVYCGESDWRKIGCNRIDNSKPHTKDNVEPCCRKCNLKLAAKVKKEKYSKKVYQYTLEGELVKVWDSVNECGRNGFDTTSISYCCNNKPHYKTHKGYRWSYVPL